MQPTKRFFTYEVTLGPMAAATGTDTDTFQVKADYDFYWFKSEAFVYDSNSLGVATTQWPLIEVMLQDGGSTEQLMNQAAAVNSVFGTGAIPYILPQPHKVPGGSTFNVTATNKHASIAYSVRLAFSGVHVFKGQSLYEQVARKR
ncbi:MAG TPA: hypothetical protein VJ437_13165 [Acidiferrobacterales bacterium]|nr:hypothetical protein [Acidiferrobacterales bacterium]